MCFASSPVGQCLRTRACSLFICRDGSASWANFVPVPSARVEKVSAVRGFLG